MAWWSKRRSFRKMRITATWRPTLRVCRSTWCVIYNTSLIVLFTMNCCTEWHLAAVFVVVYADNASADDLKRSLTLWTRAACRNYLQRVSISVLWRHCPAPCHGCRRTVSTMYMWDCRKSTELKFQWYSSRELIVILCWCSVMPPLFAVRTFDCSWLTLPTARFFIVFVTWPCMGSGALQNKPTSFPDQLS